MSWTEKQWQLIATRKSARCSHLNNVVCLNGPPDYAGGLLPILTEALDEHQATVGDLLASPAAAQTAFDNASQIDASCSAAQAVADALAGFAVPSSLR